MMGISILLRCLFISARTVPLNLRREICNLPATPSNRSYRIERSRSGRVHLLWHYVRFFAESGFVRVPKRARIKDRASPSQIYRAPSRYIERALRNSGSHSYGEIIWNKSLICNSLSRQSGKTSKRIQIKKFFLNVIQTIA